MVTKTEPLFVVARAAYRDGSAGDEPMAWTGKSIPDEFRGMLIEKIVVADPSGGIIDNITLHPSINGDCVPGAHVSLTLAVTPENVAREGANGYYVGNKVKLKALAVEVVPAPKR